MADGTSWAAGAPPPDPALPSREEVKAALVQGDLYHFSRTMFLARRGYLWLKAPHHKIICDALMRVYLGTCKRLIINIPPRYSKTELAVINFMAWCLGNVPDAEFIHTSYSGVLAINNAWQTRELVRHEDYQSFFPAVQLRADSNAKGEWRTTAGGIVYATGAGGTITGYGAGKEREGFGGAIVIDDPHKADEARSDIIRQGVIDWFQNTLESRKNSRSTPIILIMQRLHERDLAGWLLGDAPRAVGYDPGTEAGGNGEVWESVILPAIQPNGTALWAEKHTIEDLRRMEQAAPLTFAGQYGQSPAPADGNLFKPDQLRPVATPEVDSGMRWCRGWDMAATEEAPGKDPDFTVGALMGLHADGRVVIADVVRFRGPPDEVERVIVNTSNADKLRYGTSVQVSLPQDPGQAGKFQVQYLAKKLQGCRVHVSPESGDKITRAEPFASQVNVGNVSMVVSDWNDKLKSEMRMFPNAAHDDIVDALSRGYTVLGLKPAGMNISRAAIRQVAMHRPRAAVHR